MAFWKFFRSPKTELEESEVKKTKDAQPSLYDKRTRETWLVLFDEAVRLGDLARVKSLLVRFETTLRHALGYHARLAYPMIYRVCQSYLKYDLDIKTVRIIITELVYIGFNIDEVCHTGSCYTPLMLSIARGSLPLCKLLLSLGASITSPSGFLSRNKRDMPLNCAIRQGPEFVSFLLSHLEPLDEHDEGVCIRHALREAVTRTTPVILELFFDWYEKFNQSFPWEATLDFAFSHGNQDIIVAILRRNGSWVGEEDEEKDYFNLAVTKDYMHVVMFMVGQNPQLVESWMDRGEIAPPADSRVSRGLVVAGFLAVASVPREGTDSAATRG